MILDPSLRTASHFVAYSFGFACFHGLLRTVPANCCSKLLDSSSSGFLLLLPCEIGLLLDPGVLLTSVRVSLLCSMVISLAVIGV